MKNTISKSDRAALVWTLKVMAKSVVKSGDMRARKSRQYDANAHKYLCKSRNALGRVLGINVKFL